MRVIVADDIPLHVREIAEGIRARWPEWEVLTAFDGQAILDLAASRWVDVILSDIRMPRLDGLGMLSRVRALSPGTRIVFITAYPLFEYAQKALKLGATDFLLKPVDMEALYDLLSRLSRESGAEDRREAPLRQWLATPRARLDDGEAGRMSLRFPRGRLCAVRTGVADGFLLPGRLGEALSEASGCAVTAVDMGEAGEGRLYALICVQEDSRSDDLLRALRVEALRHNFRAGVSPWNASLGENAHSMWRAALAGVDRSFYESAAVLECGEACEEGAASLPSAEELLMRFNAPEDWRASLQQLLDSLARTRPSADGLIRDTRRLLQECDGRLARGEGEDAAPVDGAFRYVVFFNEYRSCLEAALAVLEKRFAMSMDRADPVTAAKNYVRLHSMEPITLAEVAAHIHLSPSYFSTLFRKSTSMRFMEYVLKVRLEKASEMLANTDMHVYEIAAACGYEDVRYFVRVYQKTYGISPTGFRRCFRAEKPE